MCSNQFLCILFFVASTCFMSCENKEMVIDLSQPMSISFWVKWNENEAYRQPFLLGTKKDVKQSILFEMNNEKAKGNFVVQYKESGKCKAIKTKKLNDNRWHHIVWYQDGGYKGLYYGLYVDGKKVKDCLVPQNKRKHFSFSLPNKTIDELKDLTIFEYTLADEEIVALYNNNKKNIKGLTDATEHIFVKTKRDKHDKTEKAKE